MMIQSIIQYEKNDFLDDKPSPSDRSGNTKTGERNLNGGRTFGSIKGLYLLLSKIKDTETTITDRSLKAAVDPYIVSVSGDIIPQNFEKVKYLSAVKRGDMMEIIYE